MSEPVAISYKLPSNMLDFAWNGTYLFYVERDTKTLTKCVGDIKRADFGKTVASVQYQFFFERDDRSQTRNPICANSTNVFCCDDNELHIFTLDLVVLKKLDHRTYTKYISFITCSNDGSVLVHDINDRKYARFCPNEELNYVKTEYSMHYYHPRQDNEYDQ